MPGVNQPDKTGEENDDNRPPKGPFPPNKPPVPTKSNLGGSPGLITSTGGLYGSKFALLIPWYDTKNKNISLNVIDSDNFNCEEDAFYYFMQPDVSIAKAVTVHQVAIIYREIGPASFFIGVIVYIRRTDTFVFKEVPVLITNDSPNIDMVNFPFPDGKLHTRYVDIRIDGERPQAYIKRFADSGPLAITSVTLAGHADVKQIM